VRLDAVPGEPATAADREGRGFRPFSEAEHARVMGAQAVLDAGRAGELWITPTIVTPGCAITKTDVRFAW
jgi:hypothetical protein